jgi:hypothetical protein
MLLDCPQPDRFNLCKKNYHFANKENCTIFRNSKVYKLDCCFLGLRAQQTQQPAT